MSTTPANASDGRSDPELAAEQRHLEEAHAALAAMRRRAEELLREARSEGRPELEHEAALLRRIVLLGESRRPLLFGRIDEESGDSWHVGRRHVEERDGDVLVVDWRAPVAVPFYRAVAKEPLGLTRRRQIMVDGGEVVAVADDLFGPEVAEPDRARLRGGDALLAELERARTGEMLDIVATIQAEQDEVIRSRWRASSPCRAGRGRGSLPSPSTAPPTSSTTIPSSPVRAFSCSARAGLFSATSPMSSPPSARSLSSSSPSQSWQGACGRMVATSRRWGG